MKKLIMTAAVLATASIVTAQTVTSANMVGYAKVNAVGDQLTLCALNFETGGATLQEIIGTDVPNLSWVYFWDMDLGQYVNAQLSGRGSWSPNLVVDLGDAFWIDSSAAAGVTNEVIFSGEVLTGDQVISLPSSLSMIGYGYPVDFDWQDTQMSADLENLSWVYVWDNGLQEYVNYQKSGRGSWNGNPSIGLSDGFWVNNVGVQVDVTETVPFTP